MPSTIGRDLLRTFVLRTNGIWPLSACNRLPYSAAVRWFVNTIRDRPEIASVYLSHGMAGNEWIPGLSDIDFTLVLERGLGETEQWKFLEWFWSAHNRMKRRFPMLGEVVILDEGEFRPWQIHSSTTSQGRSWMLLHGRKTASAISVDAKVWRTRALNAALWMYLESLLPSLSRPDSYLRQQDIARRARKISRYIAPVIGESATDAFREYAETVARTAKLLEDGVRAVTGVAAAAKKGNADGIRAVISINGGRVVTVLDDGLDSGVIRNFVRAQDKAVPVPMAHCVFAYTIRHYDPHQYAKLAGGRTVVSGEDPVPEIEPPEKATFAVQTMDKIAYLLTMTRGEELFSTREAFSVQVLESAVNHGLSVLLLLREDWVGTDPRENTARLQSSFPESYSALDEIRAHVAAGRERDARRAAFCLFRPIAAGICELLDKL